MKLSEKKCAACAEATQPMPADQAGQLLAELQGWTIVENHHLEKEWRFKNFLQALDFTNRIGQVAEDEGHHPDIFLTWGRVKVTIYTHKVNGLTESDFVLAARLDILS